MSFTKVKKGVCAAKGFVANGLNCGLNSDKNKNDLALIKPSHFYSTILTLSSPNTFSNSAKTSLDKFTHMFLGIL